MSMRLRIAKLERQVISKGQRCAICRDWLGFRTVYVCSDDDTESYVPPIDRDIPNAPERCPACGWQPMTIVIHYEKAWREHSA